MPRGVLFVSIPTIKGPLRSKTVEQVVKEFKALLAQGVFEVILIAQDLGDFGKERKEIDALENLLKEMLKVKKVTSCVFYLYPGWIRWTHRTHPARQKKYVPYLDMPIQHVSDPILKAMRRKTTKQEIISTLQKLRAKIPHITIRTSLMVGFPGETDEHFEELPHLRTGTPARQCGHF